MSSLAPITLPDAALGGQQMQWCASPPPVWAWVSWPHKPAERVAAVARGWNDRAVVIAFDTARGTVWTTVWRSAVTRRGAQPMSAAPQR